MSDHFGEDLHMHSVWSRDSNATIDSMVEDIVKIQKSDRPLRRASKTEHNSLAATVEFRDKLFSRCAEEGVHAPEVVPGVETTLWYGSGRDLKSYHVLVYFPLPHGRNFETYVNSIIESPFSLLLQEINDVKRNRMNRFVKKWVENKGLLGLSEEDIPDLRAQDVEPVIELVDWYVNGVAPMATDGPAYMRSDVFEVFNHLGISEEYSERIRSYMMGNKEEKGLVKVEYHELSKVVDMFEGLERIKALSQNAVTVFAHPWEYTKGAMETVDAGMEAGDPPIDPVKLQYMHNLLDRLQDERLLDGIQTQGNYVHHMERRIVDGKERTVKIYRPWERPIWERYAMDNGLVEISGSDAHGTEKEGVHITSLPYRIEKFEQRLTQSQDMPLLELVAAQ